MKNLFITSLFALFASQAPAADWFQDDFAKVPAGPTWEMPAPNAKLVDGTLQFTGQGDAGRVYLRTVAADYAKQSFIAEATVTIPKGAGPVGIAFFGLGCGQANPGAYHSPSTPPAVYAMICPSGFGGGLFIGACNNQETNVPGPGDGTHRLRMTWDAAGRRAKFEISPNWDGKGPFAVKFAITVNAPEPGFTDANARLFLGAGAGTSFDDFSVRAATAAEIQAAAFGDSFINDPSTRTWLPVGKMAETKADPMTAPIDAFLKSLGGNLRPLACWYSGNRLAASRTFAKGKLQMPGSQWSCQIKTTPVADDKSALDLVASFKLADGTANSAGVAIAVDFTTWSRDNYVLVPAVVYNGNRFHTVGNSYMPPYTKEMYKNPKLPLTMSDNPRLSVEPGQPGKIELLTGNAATPAICFFSPSLKRGFILLADQKSRLGNHGFFIEENAAQDRLSIVVSAPGVRERAAGFGGFRDSGDAGASWQAGDELQLKFRLYSFAAKDIPALLEKFMQVRKAFTGPNQPRQLVPMSKLADTIVPRFKGRWLTVPAGSYYACENSPHFQIGWVSGFMQTPLLAINDPTERERMCRQFDFVIGKLQGKSGYFYGGITAEGKLRSDGHYGAEIQALTRKNADTLLMFFKQFAILKAQGHGDLIKPEWEQAAKRLAQAFVNSWNRHGEFGQYLDPETGEITIFNSTSGAIAPGGLAMAGEYFNEPEFLRVAKASAEMYCRRDVVALGQTSGHSGDTSQDPDADSAYGLVESLMALHHATGDAAWLDKAKVAANLGATWTLSYDEEFPPQSQIAKMGGHMAGAVWASTQNKHGAPGICTASGDYLFKLYRATGDARYAELIRDIQHAQVEATDMPGHPTCGTGPGASMERIQPTDGEGKGSIGNFIHTQNAWTELNGLMMAMELPGIYLQTDTTRFYVFDHLQAEVLDRDQTGTTLKITNPTPYDARVAIFAESAKQARQPLSYTAYLNWPKADVKAGASRIINIGKNGQINAGGKAIPGS
jgi:hypothetical protein